MTFTFLQLMHMDWNGFVTQLEAMAFCCAVFFAAVLINSKSSTPATEEEELRRAMSWNAISIIRTMYSISSRKCSI